VNNHNHLARPGFKISEVRTEHHEFPSRQQGQDSANPPPAQSATASHATFANLPPGHPLARHPDPANGAAQSPQESVASPYGNKNGTDAESPADRPKSETDPEFYSVLLPSFNKFYAFPFENLSVRHIKGFHQAKFHRASKERNLRFLVEAMSSTLGDGVSAFDLTPADFFFMMYWQRVSSFPKTPQIVSSECSNDEHVERTVLNPEDPQYLSPDTLKIEVFLDRTTMETTYLEEWNVEPWSDLELKYGLGVETMRDLVEYADLEEELRIQNARMDVDGLAQAEIDQEMLMWLSGRAAFIKKREGCFSLKDRIEVIKKMDADDVMKLESYIDASCSYGVKEYATLTCKECGAHHRVSISVDALNFLPNSR
jgi:hypothetical protein